MAKRIKRGNAGRRKRTKRGGSRTKRKRTVRNLSTVKLGLGFPKKVLVTHKYNDQVAINTGATGQLSNYLFSCNGMYDPNITGTGHQPYYFDQLTALYDHYCVIGSKLKLRVAKSDVTTVPCTVGVYINDDTTATTSLTTAMEYSSGRHLVLTTSNQKASITRKWSAKKYFGKSVLANTDLQGTSAANPSEQSFFNFWVSSETNIQQTSVLIDVEITYIAVWKELKDIAGS